MRRRDTGMANVTLMVALPLKRLSMSLLEHAIGVLDTLGGRSLVIVDSEEGSVGNRLYQTVYLLETVLESVLKLYS